MHLGGSTARPRSLAMAALLGCALLLTVLPREARSVEEITRINNVVYAEPDGIPQAMDFYLPAATTGPRPVLIWLHGGGWQNGDRHRIPDHISDFATRGFAVVSMEYRLSHEAIYPAQIHDVKGGIRWLRANADHPRLRLDPDRIAVMGSSAGSHLAALAGTTGGVDELEGTTGGNLDHSSRVRAVVDGYGPTDFLQLDEHRLPGGREFNDADSVASRLVGCAIQTCPDRVQLANPAAFASSDDPPFLIMHGTQDLAVSPHQSRILYEALATECGEVTLTLVHGEGHSLFLRQQLFVRPPHDVTVTARKNCGPERTSQGPPATYDTIEAFLDRHLELE